MSGIDLTAPKADDMYVSVVLDRDRDTEDTCDETGPKGYACTRPTGHDSLHVATTSTEVCAIWGHHRRTLRPRVVAAVSEYAFDMQVVDRPDDAYYITRWDRATPITVVAANREAAYEKVWTVMGVAPRGAHWTARIKRVRDVREVSSDA